MTVLNNQNHNLSSSTWYIRNWRFFERLAIVSNFQMWKRSTKAECWLSFTPNFHCDIGNKWTRALVETRPTTMWQAGKPFLEGQHDTTVHVLEDLRQMSQYEENPLTSLPLQVQNDRFCLSWNLDVVFIYLCLLDSYSENKGHGCGLFGKKTSCFSSECVPVQVWWIHLSVDEDTKISSNKLNVVTSDFRRNVAQMCSCHMQFEQKRFSAEWKIIPIAIKCFLLECPILYCYLLHIFFDIYVYWLI